MTREDVVNAHMFVEAEAKRRGLQLEAFDDGLDEASERLRRGARGAASLPRGTLDEAGENGAGELKAAALVQPGGVNYDLAALRDLFKGLPSEIVVCPEYVSITGGFVYHAEGREPEDVDVVYRSRERDAKTELKLHRAVVALTGKPPHFVPEPAGPNWTSAPVYDLVLRKRRELELRHVEEPEFQALCYESQEENEMLIEGLSPAFKSYGGKRKTSKKIASLFPPHKIYVEPFIGGGAVFFAKERSEIEVISDIDRDIVAAYRFLKSATDAEIERLARMDWIGNKARFERLKRTEPGNRVEAFYRFAYLTAFSRGDRRKFCPVYSGQELKIVTRIPGMRERLKGVIIREGDYRPVLSEFDTPETLFYLDPPYPGHAHSQNFDASAFEHAVKKLKGRVLISWGKNSPRLNLGNWARRKIWTTRFTKGKPKDWEWLIANFALKPKRTALRLHELDLQRFRSEGVDADLKNPRARWRQLFADARYIANSGYPRLKAGERWGDWTLEDAERYFAKIIDALRSVRFPLIPPKQDERRYRTSFWELYRRAEKYMRSKPPSQEEAKMWAVERKKLLETELPLLELAKPFPCPGGKAWQARRIVEIIPPHEVYVEPFCGGASVFFALGEKKPAKCVLADTNPEIIACLEFLRDASDADFEWLRRQEWRASEERYNRLLSSQPRSRRERAYRWLYLSRESVLAGIGGYRHPKKYARHKRGSSVRFLANLEGYRDYLSGVIIKEQDFRQTLKEYDSEKTFFYLDPPYKDMGRHHRAVPLPDVVSAVKPLRGKWALSWLDTPEARKLLSGYHFHILEVHRGRGVYGDTWDTELLITNFPCRIRRTCHEAAKNDFSTEGKPERESIEVTEARNNYDALVLVEPHGEWLAQGKKTLVLKSVDFDLARRPLYIAQDDKILGVVTLGAPFRFNVASRFDELAKKHLVTHEERRQWWPGYTELWAFPVRKVEPFDKPRRFKRPQGPQVIIKAPIEFLETGIGIREALKPGRPFELLKAAKGYRAQEYTRIEELWETWARGYLEADPVVPIRVEPKYDGNRMAWHRDGEQAWVFTEDKAIERSKQLPEQIAELLRLPCDSVILDSEVVVWREGKPLPRRESAPMIVTQKKPLKGEDVRVNVFDILWLDGEDLSGLDYAERLGRLEKVLPRDRTFFRRVPGKVVRNRKELLAAIEWAAKFLGSEGAMLKTMRGPTSMYDVTGKQTLGWAKFKIRAEVSAIIIGYTKKPEAFVNVGIPVPREPVMGEAALRLYRRLQEPSRAYIFRCAIRRDGKLVPIEADGTYTPSDLTLRYVVKGKPDPLTGKVASESEWRGTEDPRIWTMGLGFKNRGRGEQRYGNTYATRVPEEFKEAFRGV